MVQTTTTDSNRMVLYWRNSLVDGYRIQELEYEIEVDKEAVQTGNIGLDKVAQIKDRYKEAMRTVRERGKEAEIPKEGLPVLVCPIKLSKKYNHYQESTAGGKKELIPLWIPALVNNDGQLHQRENYLPWIARDLLEPTTKKGVTIGDIEDVEKYLATHGQDMWENWQSLWTYADEMLRAMPEGELSLPGYVATGQCYIMPDIEMRGAAMNAIQVMDYVIETKPQLPLLTCYAGLQEAPEKPILDQEGHMAAAFKHNGQMGGDFPLSPSQREALHHFLTLSNGEILAVNGPPGTGKTTLMHSVIAAVWVNAALNQSEPPVIVTVSSNNQAVTNMIDSFQKGSVKDESILIERWIPGIESYGLYCPSGAASKKEENSKYQKASPGDNNFPAQYGFPALVEDASFIDRAEKYYLEHYKEFTGKTIASVRDAVAVLHQDLKFMSEKIHAELNKQQEYIKAGAIAEDTLKKVRIKYGISSIEDIINKLNHIHTQYDAEKIQLKYELSDIQDKLKSAEAQYGDVLALSKSAINPRQVKKSLLNRIFGILGLKQEEIEPSILLQKVLDRNKAAVVEITKKQAKVLEKISRKENQVKELIMDMYAIQDIYTAIGSANKEESLKSIQEKQDTQDRYEAFLLATHYWEGRWLLEVRKMQEMVAKKIYLTPTQKITNKWRRYAMLTPAIVSTLYVAPRLFTAWHRDGEYLEAEPLLEYIDLLIIDEAGQVPPELAAATFALAKKAVIVGDVLQIEPIYNLTRFVDQGNLIRHGLMQDREHYPAVKSLSASGGNAMAVAQRSCHYWLTEQNGVKYPERGMFLSEHRRCLDTIIDFCNQLAYGGRLTPMRGNELLPGALQYFNYMHIDGISAKAGSSRKNEKEAAAILDWLLLNHEYIVQKYGAGEKPAKDLVAVLTPFTAQKRIFLQAVWSLPKYKPLRGITFGTIHALQGTERDVVIFSPVYTREDGEPGEFFFNSDIRMLNVAVSRAREAFVVMGDMEVFKNSGGPAGLLAKYLFANEANCL